MEARKRRRGVGSDAGDASGSSRAVLTPTTKRVRRQGARKQLAALSERFALLRDSLRMVIEENRALRGIILKYSQRDDSLLATGASLSASFTQDDGVVGEIVLKEQPVPREAAAERQEAASEESEQSPHPAPPAPTGSGLDPTRDAARSDLMSYLSSEERDVLSMVVTGGQGRKSGSAHSSIRMPDLEGLTMFEGATAGMTELQTQIDGLETRPRVGVGVIVVADEYPGCVLLGERLGSHGAHTFALPGGHLEFNETWAMCAHREVYEETGLHIKDVRFATATNDVFPGDNKHYITLFVVATCLDSTQPETREPHKCKGWQWVDWSALGSYTLFVPLQNLLLLRFSPFCGDRTLRPEFRAPQRSRRAPKTRHSSVQVEEGGAPAIRDPAYIGVEGLEAPPSPEEIQLTVDLAIAAAAAAVVAPGTARWSSSGTAAGAAAAAATTAGGAPASAGSRPSAEEGYGVEDVFGTGLGGGGGGGGEGRPSDSLVSVRSGAPSAPSQLLMSLQSAPSGSQRLEALVGAAEVLQDARFPLSQQSTRSASLRDPHLGAAEFEPEPLDHSQRSTGDFGLDPSLKLSQGSVGSLDGLLES